VKINLWSFSTHQSSWTPEIHWPSRWLLGPQVKNSCFLVLWFVSVLCMTSVFSIAEVRSECLIIWYPQTGKREMCFTRHATLSQIFSVRWSFHPLFTFSLASRMERQVFTMHQFALKICMMRLYTSKTETNSWLACLWGLRVEFVSFWLSSASAIRGLTIKFANSSR